MPITFCASLPPWVKLKAADDTNCRRLNHTSATAGFAFLAILIMIKVITIEMIIPITGAKTMNEIVFNMGPKFTASSIVSPKNNAFAIPAPAKPPISVCDELEGIP